MFIDAARRCREWRISKWKEGVEMLLKRKEQKGTGSKQQMLRDITCLRERERERDIEDEKEEDR